MADLQENDVVSETMRDVAGQYLTFEVADEIYGLPILTVQEIIGIMPVTRVPRTPEYVRGVINLRGKVIPVVELRTKFGIGTIEDTARTCIIVVQVSHGGQDVIMGILVDEVSEVIHIGEDAIAPAPSFGSSVPVEFILGMGKVGQKVIMLLDVDKVLASDELSVIAQASQGGESSADA